MLGVNLDIQQRSKSRRIRISANEPGQVGVRVRYTVLLVHFPAPGCGAFRAANGQLGNTAHLPRIPLPRPFRYWPAVRDAAHCRRAARRRVARLAGYQYG